MMTLLVFANWAALVVFFKAADELLDDARAYRALWERRRQIQADERRYTVEERL